MPTHVIAALNRTPSFDTMARVSTWANWGWDVLSRLKSSKTEIQTVWNLQNSKHICCGLNVQCLHVGSGAFSLNTWSPAGGSILGRLWNPKEVEHHWWWTQITRGGSWGFGTQLHFLFPLCGLTENSVWPAASYSFHQVFPVRMYCTLKLSHVAFWSDSGHSDERNIWVEHASLFLSCLSLLFLSPL